MLDIAKNELYISCLRHVIKSQTGRKYSSVDGRWSDGFVLVLSGECHYSFSDGHSFTARAGDLIYLAKGSSYKKELITEPFLHIHTDFDFICNETEKRKSANVSLKNPSETEALFRRLMKKITSSEPSAKADCISLLYSIYGNFIAASFPTYLSSGSKNAVSKAKELIYERLSNPLLSVKSLAEDMSISEVHLRKIFKASEGISPSKFIVLARLERAKILFSLEDISLDEIAYQCGFSSLQYFCRVFKEKTGMTPSEYRKKYIKIGKIR
ncbi:MAG: helix-turn-helix transcriptional regulator [Clostridia bacterium]|nr:helix-turn-helix transcriptional regulator [Clostridia bacterium]